MRFICCYFGCLLVAFCPKIYFVKKKKIIVMGNFLFSQGPVAAKMVSELSVYWKCSIIHQGQHNDLKLSCGIKSLAIFLISFMIIGCVNQCSPEKENQLDRREGGRVQPLKKWHSHGGYDINWLEPTGFKMAKNSTSSGSWASLYAHCNSS